MTCKDCIHYDVCQEYLFKCAEHGEAERLLNPCRKFKNKADFVEVVRCKDCEYKEKETNKWCKYWYKFCAYDDNYCCNGKRKTVTDIKVGSKLKNDFKEN